ncbi:MAG: hypothetical protein OXK82_07520 [Deltaproteobacteria bacterium]|nr:hypothetical protein [Deltaproteobacteria bacterium]
MSKTTSKHIRIEAEHWKRLEDAARERNVSPNQLLVELAMDALDRSQWPRTDLEILMVRSCLFTAQATARDMIAAGRQNEIDEIAQLIDNVAPPLPENL